MQSKIAIATLSAVAAALGSAAAYPATTFYDSKSAFDLVASTVLIEDFESFSPKDTGFFPTLSTGFLTFTAYDPPSSPNLVVTSPGYTNFGVNVSPTTSSVLSTSGDENFEMFFALAQTAAGFEGYLNGLGPGTVTVKNGALVLGTYDLPNPAGGAITYVGVVSDTPFSSIVWDTTAGGVRNSGIDNISVAAVPEPSTWVTLLASFLAFAFLARRRVVVALPG